MRWPSRERKSALVDFLEGTQRIKRRFALLPTRVRVSESVCGPRVWVWFERFTEVQVVKRVACTFGWRKEWRVLRRYLED